MRQRLPIARPGPNSWSFPNLARWTASVAIAGFLLSVASSGTTTQEISLGYQPKQAYASGVTEDVNLYNLNLIVSLPLSPSYTLSDSLTYGLTAYYNGGITWGSSSTFNSANEVSWIGTGWRLDFGKVVNDIQGNCAYSSWVSPGGALHPLTLNSYTEDGSDIHVNDGVYLSPTSPSSCRVPTVLLTDFGEHTRHADPNTGQITQIWDRYLKKNVSISYVQPADFLAIDANAPASTYDYRRPAPPGQPANYYKEQTLAIKTMTDSFGRTMTTTMTRFQATGFDKFLLTDIAAPVFGGGTGHWTLYYEIRQITSSPPGWPTLSPTAYKTLAFLVRVELPADASGNRLTYTFDYDPWGEMTEVRTPSGVRTVYGWGNEYIDPGVYQASSTPKRRVIASKTVYADPYGSPTSGATWEYAHSRYPASGNCAGLYDEVADPWRAIISDPAGNDTEYRFYNYDYPPGIPPIWVPRELLGAIRYYKGQTKRWLDGAICFSEGDPSHPGGGRLLRGEYYRYSIYVDPNIVIGGPQPVHLLTQHTVYYDDPIGPSGMPDPNSVSANDIISFADNEMTARLMSQDHQDVNFSINGNAFEGYAWHAQVRDPSSWNYRPSVGTTEYETVEAGNLVGPKAIKIEGDLDDPCPRRPLFSGGRKVKELANGLFGPFPLSGETLKELSHEGIDPNGVRVCTRRYDLSRTYSFGDLATAFLHDRQTAFEVDPDTRMYSGIGYRGGDPNSTDPNSQSTSTVAYREGIGFSYGLEATRSFTGTSWNAVDRAIDASSGLPSSSRDPSGVQTTLNYDALGRLLASALPAPEYPTYVTYGASTQTFTDTTGQTNTHRYSRTVEVFRGSSLTDTEHLYARYEYDGLGRLVRERRRHPSGSLIEQTRLYDLLGSPTFESEWHGATDEVPPPAFAGTTTTYYDGDSAYPPSGRRDPFSRPMKITDPSGATREFQYFGLNDAVTVKNINGNPATTAVTKTYRDYRGNVRIVDAPEGADALYDYDHAGRLTGVRLVSSYIPAVFDNADPNAIDLRQDRFAASVTGFIQSRTFARDALGLVRSSTEPEKGTTTYYSYDALGNPTLTQDNAGQRQHMNYDPAGRLVQLEVEADGATSFKKRQIFAYANDPNSASTHGQALSRLIHAEARVNAGLQSYVQREFNYGGLNGRLSEEKDAYVFWQTGTNPFWVSTLYSFNNLGLPSHLTYPTPAGSSHPPTELAYTYQHGALARLDSNKSTSDPSVFEPLVTIGYHLSGASASMTYANGVVETMSVDTASRVSGVSVDRAGVNFWNSGSYSYDGAGNLTHIGGQSYGYDKIGRLTSSSTASMSTPPAYFSQTYMYDKYGSMTYRGGPGTTWRSFSVSSSTNQVTSTSSPGLNLSFSYDRNGSVTTDGVFDYVYDQLERLTNVRLKDDTHDLEQYGYDDRGWRTRKISDAEGRALVYFRNAEGLVLTEYAVPTGSTIEPHWRKDYVYALGRHVAAIENAEPDEPGWSLSQASYPSYPAQVSLTWSSSGSPDVYGYHVYRSSGGPTGTYVRLTTDSTTETSWLDSDPNLVAGQAYYYKLTSVDMSTMESRDTSVRKITPGDATPPQTVVNLTGDLETVVLLGWQAAPDTDGDLQGYRVYRSVSTDPPGTGWTLLSGLLPLGTVGYVDSAVSAAHTYLYEVRSVDTAGRESSPSPDVVVDYPASGGGGGGGCTTTNCFPGVSKLLLPACRPSIGGLGSMTGDFCLPGEVAEPLAVHSGEEPDWRIVFYHVDHLGTPRVLTDELGQVLAKYALHPYGSELPGSSFSQFADTAHRFTGHERDPDAAQDYLLARYYSELTGRFRETDLTHLNVDGARIGSWNAYSYSNNDPLQEIDPDGLATASIQTRGIDFYVCHPGPTSLIPDFFHVQIFYDDGTNSGLFSNGRIGPDSPRNFKFYKVVIDGLDGDRMRLAESLVRGRFSNYDKRTSNCQDYVGAVLDAYAKLGRGDRLLIQCRNGDVDACRTVRDECQSGLMPITICREYDDAKKKGQLPAHMPIGFVSWQ